MKKLSLLLISATLLIACNNNGSGNHKEGHNHDSAGPVATKDTSKKSIPSEVNKRIDNADVKIKYHSPGVRGRVIWGGLVPYDEVWVTGAHSATTLEVNKDFQVNDKSIKAGKYAIFTIPGKEDWTVIINSNWDQHLADEYSEKDDLARLKVKPQMQQDISERLKYEIIQTGKDSATIAISWEKVRVEFPLVVRQ
jgi:hypothetical protein